MFWIGVMMLVAWVFFALVSEAQKSWREGAADRLAREDARLRAENQEKRLREWARMPYDEYKVWVQGRLKGIRNLSDVMLKLKYLDYSEPPEVQEAAKAELDRRGIDPYA